MRPHLDRGHGLLPGRRGPEHGAPAGDRPQAGELGSDTGGGVAAVMYINLGNNCKHFNVVYLCADKIVI